MRKGACILSEDEVEICRIRGWGRVYYYQGNIFSPLEEPKGSDVGKVRKFIREFLEANAERVAKDRADPAYKTLVEIFDEQYPNVSPTS